MEGPRPLPRLGRAVVRGRSMLPTLRDGDRLLVRYDAVPKTGHVAIVRLPGGVVAVKRLTSVTATSVTVTSDNAAEGTSAVLERADVLGVVLLRHWPRPGRVPPLATGPRDGGHP